MSLKSLGESAEQHIFSTLENSNNNACFQVFGTLIVTHHWLFVVLLLHFIRSSWRHQMSPRVPERNRSTRLYVRFVPALHKIRPLNFQHANMDLTNCINDCLKAIITMMLVSKLHQCYNVCYLQVWAAEVHQRRWQIPLNPYLVSNRS